MMSHADDRKSLNNGNTIPKITADFVCFVCGAVFTTDEDRKAHLENEGHGKLHDDIEQEEMRKALEQEKLNEGRIHHI
jgi:hypothetical protein